MKSFLFRFITPIQEQMMSDKNRNTSKYQLTIGLLFAAIAGLWLSSTNTYNDNNRQVVAQQDNSVIRVAAGGGNSTDVKTVFIPQNIEIQAGRSINWNNPTPVGEPHSVTFFKDTNQFPPFLAPFSVPASTEFNSLMPSPNLEPLTVTNNDTATKTCSSCQCKITQSNSSRFN
jgi:plastocyanin